MYFWRKERVLILVSWKVHKMMSRVSSIPRILNLELSQRRDNIYYHNMYFLKFVYGFLISLIYRMLRVLNCQSNPFHLTKYEYCVTSSFPNLDFSIFVTTFVDYLRRCDSAAPVCVCREHNIHADSLTEQDAPYLHNQTSTAVFDGLRRTISNGLNFGGFKHLPDKSTPGQVKSARHIAVSISTIPYPG